MRKPSEHQARNWPSLTIPQRLQRLRALPPRIRLLNPLSPPPERARSKIKPAYRHRSGNPLLRPATLRRRRPLKPRPQADPMEQMGRKPGAQQRGQDLAGGWCCARKPVCAA